MKKSHYYLLGILILIISFFLDNSVANFFVNNKIGFFDNIAVFIYNIEIYVFFAFALIILLFFKKKDKIFPLLLTSALVLGTTQILKMVIARPRPFTKFPFSDIGENGINRSFPSGHATTTASVFKFFRFDKVLSYFWIAVTVIVVFTRVYLGMHYLSDVVAGLLLGFFISDLSVFCVEKLKKRRH